MMRADAEVRVLVAEDDPEALQWLCALVASLRPGWSVCARVASVAGVQRAVAELAPDLLLLDIHLDEAPGDAWFTPLMEAGHDVIFITADPGYAAQAFGGEAIDYLVKPVTRQRFEKALGRFEWRRRGRAAGREIMRLRDELVSLLRQSREDALTGLANRRAFDDLLQQEIQRARRYQRPLALAMVDVDHFKRYNDEGSHLLGDDVLRELATVLRDAVRSHDLAARIGGDEFAVLLPETDEAGAEVVAEAIGARLRAHAWPGQVMQIRPPTLSIGVAALGPESPSEVRDLLARCDAQLYRAKAAGRATPSQLPPGAADQRRRRRLRR